MKKSIYFVNSYNLLQNRLTILKVIISSYNEFKEDMEIARK